MDQVIKELKRPLDKTYYALACLLVLTLTGLYPLMRPDTLQTLVFVIIASLAHLYLVARRLSDLDKHFLFSLVIFVPIVGIVFSIYLGFIEKEDWSEHLALFKEKLA